MIVQRASMVCSLWVVLLGGALWSCGQQAAAAEAAFEDGFAGLGYTQSAENVALVRQYPRVPLEPDVRIGEEANGQNPQVIRLTNGELLCAFGSFVCRSVDGGRTWSSPLPTPEGVTSDVAQTADGKVWLPSRTGYVICSEDNGQTWSEPIPLANEEFIGEPEGDKYMLFLPVGELSNGDFLWICCANYPPEETQKSFPKTRVMQGMIGQRATVVLPGITDGKAQLLGPFLHPELGNPDEWHAVETDIPGRLVAILRQQEAGDYYYTSVSTDYGRTFELARPSPVWHSPVQQRALMTKLDDGTLVVAYGERQNRRRMMAVASFDHGETWETHRKLVISNWPDLIIDHGYPHICQSGPHELLGVWGTVHSPGTVYGNFVDARFFKDVYGGVSLAHTGLPLDERCIAHWSFDEASGPIAHDPARYNYGHIVGPQRAPGRFGRALQFDGEDDHVMVPDCDTLRVPQFYTLEAWINTEDASRDQTILDKTFGETVQFVPYRLELHEGRLRFTTGVDSFSGEQTLEANRWYHVAVRVWPWREYSQVSFYINGELDGEVHALPGTRGPDAYLNAVRRNDRRVDGQPLYQEYYPGWEQELEALTIGISKDYKSQAFVGMIDEVAIYAEPLTEEEIGQNGRRRYLPSGRIVSQAIRREPGQKWGIFAAEVDRPEGTTITFTVLDPQVPELRREIDPGTDLSSLSATTINLRAELRSEDGSQTPALKSWAVR